MGFKMGRNPMGNQGNQGTTEINAIQCNGCGHIIWSTHTHDYRRCPCGLVAIDGGFEYIRIIGTKANYRHRKLHIPNNRVKDGTIQSGLAKATDTTDLSFKGNILEEF
jgi:hypothetical protein